MHDWEVVVGSSQGVDSTVRLFVEVVSQSTGDVFEENVQVIVSVGTRLLVVETYNHKREKSKDMCQYLTKELEIS